MEAAHNGKVEDFEVGVFCGEYKTEVPEGYFEHLQEVRGKKRKLTHDAVAQTAVANSGAVNVAKRGLAEGDPRLELRGLATLNGDETSSAALSPDNRQDIRCVGCLSPVTWLLLFVFSWLIFFVSAYIMSQRTLRIGRRIIGAPGGLVIDVLGRGRFGHPVPCLVRGWRDHCGLAGGELPDSRPAHARCYGGRVQVMPQRISFFTA